jgi:cation/acetate symporter
MAGLGPPERDIGTARELIGASFALIGLFALLLLAFTLLDRLGHQTGRMPVAVISAAVLLFVLTAWLAPGRRPADYYVADRMIAAVPGGLSGGIVLCGLLAVGIAEGAVATLGGAAAMFSGLLLGPAFAAVALGPGLRRFGGYDSGDFAAARFSASARALAALVSFAAAFLILIACVEAVAALLAATLGLSQERSVYLATGIVALVALPGGSRSTTAAQVTQYVLAALACLAPAALLAVQGAGDDQAEAASALVAQLTALPGGSWPDAALPALTLAAGAAALPFVLAQAHNASSARDAALAQWWTALFAIGLVASSLVLAVGLIGTTGSIAALDLRLLRDSALAADLPAIGGGLILSGVLAALLAASQAALFSAASAVSHGIWDEIIDRRGPAGRRLVVARLAVIGTAAGAGWLVAQPLDMPALLPWALALSAAAAFPPLVLGLWWRRCNAPGAVAGTLVGAGLVGFAFAAEIGATPAGAALGPTEAAAYGLLAALTVAALVSLSTGAPAPEKLALLAELRTRRERPPMRERPA